MEQPLQNIQRRRIIVNEKDDRPFDRDWHHCTPSYTPALLDSPWQRWHNSSALTRNNLGTEKRTLPASEGCVFRWWHSSTDDPTGGKTKRRQERSRRRCCVSLQIESVLLNIELLEALRLLE